MSVGKCFGRFRASGDEGQALPLLVLLCVVAGCLAILLGQFGQRAVERAESRTAADAAALAGALDGEEAARLYAELNGGRLVDFELVGSEAEAQVWVGDEVMEVARARRVGGEGLVGFDDPGGLHPLLRAAVARAESLLGRSVPIASGYRSTEQQRRLWANRQRNPYPVAPPGTSMHERGLAIDVPRSFVPVLLTVAASSGLCHPLPGTDPVHFELCR